MIKIKELYIKFGSSLRKTFQDMGTSNKILNSSSIAQTTIGRNDRCNASN